VETVSPKRGRDATETELDVILDGHKREDILYYFFGDLAPEKITEYGAPRQAGARIGLATSASHKRVHATIAELGLTHYFDVIVTGDEVACGKPDPSICRLAAEYLQAAPQNLVAIEDALAGVQAATTAGIRCIGLAFGAKAEILRSAGADPVVSHFQQLSLPTLQEHFSIERHSMAASEEPGHDRSQ
jgi:HAD superfamily hydrolase (TIGR01509 family)